MRDFLVNEGNMIGGQEPQALGTVQVKITASVAVTKGQLVEMTGDWTVGPAGDGSIKVVGIAFNDAAIGAKVVISTEGFVKVDASAAVITAGDRIVASAGGKVKKCPGATVADINAIVGTAVAGCLASGVAYIKFSI